MKKNNQLSFQSFELFEGEKEKKFFNWIISVDVIFLIATFLLMIVAESIFHMHVLDWKEYWILFFSNAIFFSYFIVALKNNFKIWLLKYLLAIFIPFLFGGWIYFSDPAYSKILFGGAMMMLPMVGFVFYNSRLLLMASFVVTAIFSFLFFYFPKIGSVFQLYEIYLTYMFLLMGTVLYFSLIERTRVFLKELLAARSELEEAKIVLEIKIKARTQELEELAQGLDKKVGERTHELEEGRRGLLNILEDIEESRGEAEEEKNKTMAVLTNFSDGIFVFDKKDRLTLINPEAEELCGIKAKDVLDKSIAQIGRKIAMSELVKLIGLDMDPISRKELVLKNNTVVEISVIQIKRDEEETGNLVILHDITREKRIEKMKSEFVTIAAHQLRTPLSAIKWTLKMFLEGDLGKISEEQEGFLKKTYKSNERMIGLIDDLLNVSRIEEGRYIYNLAVVDITKVIKYLIDIEKISADQKGIKLEYKKFKKKLPSIKIDEEKISLAIQNLIDNAIRYTPEGGKVTVSLKDKKEGLEISVKDDGVGIPKDEQKRVFTKFFRGTNAAKIDTEGSGLGLFIVKNIVDAHKGKVSLKSEKNKGTTFSILLPKQS